MNQSELITPNMTKTNIQPNTVPDRQATTNPRLPLLAHNACDMSWAAHLGACLAACVLFLFLTRQLHLCMCVQVRWAVPAALWRQGGWMRHAMVSLGWVCRCQCCHYSCTGEGLAAPSQHVASEPSKAHATSWCSQPNAAAAWWLGLRCHGCFDALQRGWQVGARHY